MKNPTLLLVFLIQLSFDCYGKTKQLIDDIASVFNTEVVTRSELSALQLQIPKFKTIAPMVFKSNKYELSDLSKLLVEFHLKREALKKIGFEVSESQVNDMVNRHHQQLGLSSAQFGNELKNFGLNMDQFKWLTRLIQEENLFLEKILMPLISPTKSEIQNAYFDKFKTKIGSSYSLNLKVFTVQTADLSKEQRQQLFNLVNSFDESPESSPIKSKISVTTINDLESDGLEKNVFNLISDLPIGEISKALTVSKVETRFFKIIDKKITDSAHYLANEKELEREIRLKKSNSLRNVVLESEKNNHFVKTL